MAGLVSLAAFVAVCKLWIASSSDVVFDRSEGIVRRDRRVICELHTIRAVLIDAHDRGASLLLVFWDSTGREQRLALASGGNLERLKVSVDDFIRASSTTTRH